MGDARFFKGQVSAICAMSAALQGVRCTLGLTDTDDGATQVIAHEINELAHRGEHDPFRLASAVLKILEA